MVNKESKQNDEGNSQHFTSNINIEKGILSFMNEESVLLNYLKSAH